MKAYKVTRNLKVVEVDCPNGMEFPKLDADGDKIYENTHFATKMEALEKVISKCDIWISNLARDIESLKQDIKDNQDILTEYAIARNRLIEEWEQERSHHESQSLIH